MNYADFHWVLLRNAPFFPDTQVVSPYIDMSDQSGPHQASKWRAIWHTDRRASDRVLEFDIPSSPDR